MLLKLQMEASHPKHTKIEISKDDHKHLHAKGWLNDNLIDYWMQFQPDSFIYVFSTHFYTKLEDKSVNSVLSWTANKRIDVFSKKFIYVPTHKNQHLSLMVVINAGMIDLCDELNNQSEIPAYWCILTG
jgi:Ulp1 family protease